MSLSASELTIGAVAQAAGVNVETIRFYQRKGLLPEPDKPYGSIRRYAQQDVARVRFVKAAQRLGFSLEEVGTLLRLQDGTHCRKAQALATDKLSDVRARLADLRRIEAALAAMIDACGSAPARVSCPLIAALQSESAPAEAS